MLLQNYRLLLNKIEDIKKSSPFQQNVTCIIVTKGRPIQDIQSLYDAGQRDFGENYAQELLQKVSMLPSNIRWHFLGHLQTNKVKKILPYLYGIHTLDSLNLIRSLNKYWNKTMPLPLWIQVNLENQEGQSGLQPENVLPFFKELPSSPSLSIRGLMTLAAKEVPAEKTFSKLRLLEESLRPKTQGELSMGMSQDFGKAILEGATHIRIGSRLWS